MKAEERRERIMEVLRSLDRPVKGTELAKKMDVTRQIIVSDVNILRAKGMPIAASPSGYQLKKNNLPGSRIRSVLCRGTENKEAIEQELFAVVDNGGTVQEIQLRSADFGTVTVAVNLRSRRDVRLYLEKVCKEKGNGIVRVLQQDHILIIKIHEDGEWDDMVRSMKKMQAVCNEDTASLAEA